MKLRELPHITEEHGTPLLLELTELHVLGLEVRILGLELVCQAPHLRLCELLRPIALGRSNGERKQRGRNG